MPRTRSLVVALAALLPFAPRARAEGEVPPPPTSQPPTPAPTTRAGTVVQIDTAELRQLVTQIVRETLTYQLAAQQAQQGGEMGGGRSGVGNPNPSLLPTPQIPSPTSSPQVQAPVTAAVYQQVVEAAPAQVVAVIREKGPCHRCLGHLGQKLTALGQPTVTTGLLTSTVVPTLEVISTRVVQAVTPVAAPAPQLVATPVAAPTPQFVSVQPTPAAPAKSVAPAVRATPRATAKSW